MNSFKLTDLIDVFNFISQFFGIYYRFFSEDRSRFDVDRFMLFEQEHKIFSPDNSNEEYFKGVFGDYIPEDPINVIYEFRYCKDNIKVRRNVDQYTSEIREHVFYKKKLFLLISDTNYFRMDSRISIFSDIPDEIYITLPSNFSELDISTKFNRCVEIFSFILNNNIEISSTHISTISKILSGLIFDFKVPNYYDITKDLKRHVSYIVGYKDDDQKPKYYMINHDQQYILRRILQQYLYI